MIQQLLYTVHSSNDLDTAWLALLSAAIVAALWMLVWQYRKSKELKNDIAELGKIRKTNVEYEFVLKTMRLSTWHIRPETREIVFDNDFRDKSDTYVPPSGGTSADLGGAIVEQDRQLVGKMISDLCEGRIEEAHVEYRVQVGNTGRTYWSESYGAVAERDADGKPSNIVGTSQRIDERKQMEQALIDARNRAEESDRLKTAFLANMSHEIRTPLNAIIGFTSVLPDVQDADERKQLLDLIHENTQKLLLIIDDVVNISKVESGKEELVMSQFDLNLLLQEQADNYRPHVKDGVELDTMFAAEQLTITTDRNRVVEVVKHLLQNATKFTDKGHIILGYDNPQDGRLHIWVRDTGKGIAPEFQERVFERFFKVDEFIPGAGLGLSICRTMAYSLGGTVSVESQLGEGSNFVFDLPIQ